MNSEISALNSLYMGTWQFGGQFRIQSEREIVALLDRALVLGIRRFDTAAVYGAGRVETILGEILPSDARVVTKIPAIQKPSIHSHAVLDAYPPGHINASVHASLTRLKRPKTHTLLLHNWFPGWKGSEADALLQQLTTLREAGLTEKIGISLPNGFPEDSLDDAIFQSIDVIEAPFNSAENWILNYLGTASAYNVEILMRSLFRQGLELRKIRQEK